MIRRASISIDSLMDILRREESMRYQDPKPTRHGKQTRIRPYVTERQPDGSFRRVRKSITLGDAVALGRQEVNRRRNAVMDQINAGTLIVQRQLKFSELIERYRLTGLPLVAESTQGKYRPHLAKMEAAFGRLDLGEVTPVHVQDWLTSLRGRYAKNTLLDILNLGRAVMAFAARMNIWREHSPFAGIRLRSDVAPREKRLLSAADTMRLCAELDRCEAVVQGRITGAHVRLMVLIAAVTTARIGEILRMRGEDIDDSGRVVIPVSKTEAGRRTVWLGALTPEVRAIAETGLLFGDAQGRPVDPRDIQQHILRPTAKACGLYWPGFGFHSFRRMAVTLHQQAGATPIEAMKAAGHATAAMTARYTLQDVEREKDRADKLSRRLAG